MDTTDSPDIHFLQKVRELFTFLGQLGFSEVESLPTIVRYKNGDIEVDIYHGRQSYEIGADIVISGVRYSISELIQASDPELSKRFYYTMTTTPKGVAKALEELSALMRRFGSAALKGDTGFVSNLAKQREKWSKDYALKVLAEQLRPKATEAFRQKDYSTAANLYSSIRECLSDAELKKLRFAIEHSKN